LMKAEAILRSNLAVGTQVEVDALVKQVRDRAGLTATVLSNVTLDQLLAESRKEFMNEGRRWHELVRTGKVVSVMTAWKNSEDQAREKKILAIDNNSIIYPVPAIERSTNPLLTQNPGY
jgi:starch-binding outer membrane protein, SusD/RagB family